MADLIMRNRGPYPCAVFGRPTLQPLSPDRRSLAFDWTPSLPGPLIPPKRRVALPARESPRAVTAAVSYAAYEGSDFTNHRCGTTPAIAYLRLKMRGSALLVHIPRGQALILVRISAGVLLRLDHTRVRPARQSA